MVYKTQKIVSIHGRLFSAVEKLCTLEGVAYLVIRHIHKVDKTYNHPVTNKPIVKSTYHLVPRSEKSLLLETEWDSMEDINPNGEFNVEAAALY